MVTDTRAASSGGRPGLTAGRLRPLNSPRPLDVETDANGVPTGLYLSAQTGARLGGHRCAVESVLEKWRIDDEWWREQPVSRVYWRLFLENGCAVDVYHDVARGRWYKQAYTG